MSSCAVTDLVRYHGTAAPEGSGWPAMESWAHPCPAGRDGRSSSSSPPVIGPPSPLPAAAAYGALWRPVRLRRPP